MMSKIAFLIGARNSAYDINVTGIKEQHSKHDITIVTVYELPHICLADFDKLFVLTWWDKKVTDRVSKVKGPKKIAIVGSHVHIDRGWHGHLKHYDEILCVSPRLQQALASIGYPATVIHYYYLTEFFHPARRSDDGSTIEVNDTDTIVRISEKLRVGWAGRPGRDVKRYPIFRGAVKDLKGVFAKVSFVETSRNDEGELVVGCDLTQEEMGDFYRGLDYYVVCSETEGQPKTAIEAALCGIPIIGTDVGVLRELQAMIMPEPLTVEFLRHVLKRVVGVHTEETWQKLSWQTKSSAMVIFNHMKVKTEWNKLLA